MLNEDVKKCVVEGHIPELSRKHCAEVRAALAHDGFEADHSGALGGHCHVLGGGREPDDVRPVVGEQRLVPGDAQLQLRVVLSSSSTPAPSAHDCRRSGWSRETRRALT